MLFDKRATGMAAVARVSRSSPSFFLWLFPSISCFLAVLLGRPWAIYAPDAGLYRLLAAGHRAAVPAPFSARILTPVFAQWLGSITGLGIDNGFLVLGILALLAMLVSMAYLLRFQDASPGILAAIFLLPFWIELFHDYYLPDLLHTAILAALLVCLVSGRVTLAMLLLFPAYLTRESSLLIALCLVWAAWRRVSIRAISVGFLATVGGMLVSRHLVQLGALNVEGVSSGKYMLGKVVWSFFRNIFGLPLWANAMPRTLPGCNPMWRVTLPHWLHFGAMSEIGFCHPSLWGPARLLLAWSGVFGIGPAVATAYIGDITSHRALFGGSWSEQGSTSGEPTSPSAGATIAFRFCVIYGVLTFFLAPLLGASVDRLVDYAWPFYLIALPWVACGLSGVRFPKGSGFWLLLLHLAACWIAWFGFSREKPTAFDLRAGLLTLSLNIIAYFVIKRPFRRPIASAAAAQG